MLSSLNLRWCSRVTDDGLLALSKGCKLLNSLNLAGCNKVTESGVCAVACECKGLQLLNLNGVEKVTENSLTQLLLGLPFSERAESFVGFKPRSNATELRFKAQQRVINDAASMRIQAQFRGYQVRVMWLHMLEQKRMDASASVIQFVWKRFCFREKHGAHFTYSLENSATLYIQSKFRQHMAKKRIEALREPIRIAILQAHAMTIMQSIIRGARARKYNKHVPLAIGELRRERWLEVLQAAAACIQAAYQIYHTKKQIDALREEVYQRRRDLPAAVLHMQRMVRGRIARTWCIRLWVELERTERHKQLMSIVVQTAYRAYYARVSMHIWRSNKERAMIMREATALYLQAFYRGYRGKLRWYARRREWQYQCYQATQIQRMWRGKTVPIWHRLRFTKIVGQVRRQYRLDMAQVRTDVAKKDMDRLDDLARDSASDVSGEEEEEGFGSSGDDWELQEDPNCPGEHYYYNVYIDKKRLDPPAG
jgi:hypothetical protein